MRIPFLLVFLFTSLQLFAQKIQVLQEKTNVPVNDVVLYNTNKSKTGLTDFDGYVDISRFSEDEIIHFDFSFSLPFTVQEFYSHPSYSLVNAFFVQSITDGFVDV